MKYKWQGLKKPADEGNHEFNNKYRGKHVQMDHFVPFIQKNQSVKETKLYYHFFPKTMSRRQADYYSGNKIPNEDYVNLQNKIITNAVGSNDTYVKTF